MSLLEVGDDDPLTADLLAPVEADVRAVGRGAPARRRWPGTPRPRSRRSTRHRLLCAHRRGPRGVQHWEWLATRLARRGPRRRPGAGAAAGRRAPPRRAAARHDQRLRGQPVQRRHRRGRGRPGRRDAGLVRPGRGADGGPPGPPRRRAPGPRHDRPPQPGLPVRPGDAWCCRPPTPRSPPGRRSTPRSPGRCATSGSSAPREAFAAAVDRPAARATGLRERL